MYLSLDLYLYSQSREYTLYCRYSEKNKTDLLKAIPVLNLIV